MMILIIDVMNDDSSDGIGYMLYGYIHDEEDNSVDIVI